LTAQSAEKGLVEKGESVMGGKASKTLQAAENLRRQRGGGRGGGRTKG